jgi:broad specificity phosphatase PhoE
MNIYLLRHGQKNNQPGDPELTVLGFEQARQTGEFLHDKNVEAIFTSPSLRTKQTAAVIGELLSLPVQISPLLKERMYWLDPKQTRADFLREWARATAQRNYVPKNGQSSAATGERLAHFLGKLAAQNYHSVLLVSHGGAIMDLLRHFFDEADLSPLKKKYPAGWDYQCHNCSLTQVCLQPQPVLKLLNSTTHLTTLTES